MALTEHDKKTLSQSDQQKIVAATSAWEAANKKGDTAGMAKAAADAAAVRNNAGYKTDSSGNYTDSTSSKNSQYTNTDYSTIGQQQMASGASWQDVQSTLNSRVNKALNTEGLEKYAYDDKYWAMYNYIQGQKNAEIFSNYEDKLAELNQGKPDEYESKYDPKIDALLNEILNRDDFSYNVANDPLYQQYADMYRREGDRAMKETMAEAAAGAGGMNTYAVTAAQQANSYYNSQLNDRIPELYQLAYEMYLNDKESKVQDLGILQNMDATQYNRYRDTINDFYNDRNFAYGAYQDAVQQGNWQTNFDYNSALDNRNFNNGEYWKNKEWDYNDYWANKEWDYNDEWKNKEWSKQEQDDAKAEVEYWMSNGIMPDDELIAKSGMNKANIEQYVAQVKAAQAAKVTTSGSGGGGDGYKGKEKEKEKEVEDDDLGYTPTKDTGEDDKGDGSVIGLGIGPVSDDLLEKLAKAGAIVGDDNGNLYWADGWNRTNYEKRLNDFSQWGNFITLPML